MHNIDRVVQNVRAETILKQQPNFLGVFDQIAILVHFQEWQSHQILIEINDVLYQR